MRDEPRAGGWVDVTVEKCQDSLDTYSRQVYPDTMVRRSQSNPKPDALRQIAENQAVLLEAQAALREAVADARSAGCSWAEIGEVFGVSRQSAQERFGKEGR